MQVRKMQREDIPQVLALLRAEWPDEPAVFEDLPNELWDMFSNATYRPTFFVADADEKIVGCAAWNWAWFNYDNYDFFWMCVHPDYRRRGIGAKLIEVRIDDVLRHKRPDRPIYIWLSTPLRERYERFGFRVVLNTPRTFGHGQSSVMVREIASTPTLSRPNHSGDQS